MKNEPKLQATIQRAQVQKNPEGRFTVRGYHTGDFVGTVVQSGLSGAEFYVEQTFGRSENTSENGSRLWIPFGNFIILTLEDGGTK